MNAKISSGSDLSKLLGKSVLEFFPELCNNCEEIESLTFVTYGKLPGVDSRLKALLQSEKIAEVQSIVNGRGIPFWLPAICMVTNSGHTSEEIVASLMTHPHDPSAKSYTIRRDEISARRICSIIEELPEGRGLAVCSKVLVGSGCIKHIPMIDFLCSVSDLNAHAACEAMVAIGQSKGILVQSGQSFHSYGMSLLSHGEWLIFLANALLLSPITDPRYIAHRLLEGECLLKVAGPSDRRVPTISNIIQSTAPESARC